MDWLTSLPIWLLCVLIFVLRVCDVTLGTLRTVSIVKGQIASAMVMGFFELIVWVAVISQVISRLHESWWLGLAYAGGFAAGNGVGLVVERRMALGTTAVRILSQRHGDSIAESLRRLGHAVTTFSGDGAEGPVTLIYAMVPRRSTRRMIEVARGVDADLVYVMEPAYETNGAVQARLRPVPHPTGWRAILKKK